MIIKVRVSEETWARILTGKRVEGTLGYDKWTGEKNFNAFNRKQRVYVKDKRVKTLPWGWVKESVARIKMYGSFPKNVGTSRVLGLLDEHIHEAKDALIERELIEFC
jgi:hypothetical protein